MKEIKIKKEENKDIRVINSNEITEELILEAMKKNEAVVLKGYCKKFPAFEKWIEYKNTAPQISPYFIEKANNCKVNAFIQSRKGEFPTELNKLNFNPFAKRWSFNSLKEKNLLLDSEELEDVFLDNGRKVEIFEDLFLGNMPVDQINPSLVDDLILPTFANENQDPLQEKGSSIFFIFFILCFFF
jgi:hypothetical protein